MERAGYSDALEYVESDVLSASIAFPGVDGIGWWF
jgi:hypothetical protein